MSIIGSRKDGTNPRAMGTNPRSLGTNPRATGTNEREVGMPGYRGVHNRFALRAWKRAQKLKTAQEHRP